MKDPFGFGVENVSKENGNKPYNENERKWRISIGGSVEWEETTPLGGD